MSMIKSGAFTENLDEEGINNLLEKMFRELDTDGNQRFSKQEFPKVIHTLIGFTGG